MSEHRMDMPETQDPLEYYARPGKMSDPGVFSGLFHGLPPGISELCEVVQGILVHNYWAESYGVTLTEERVRELQIRPVAEQLARIMELENKPLTTRRPPDKRLICNCRDFSLKLCSMLRHRGAPARARCGFASYFIPGSFEDHWICEYWDPTRDRWVMVDSQIDSFQKKECDIRIDTLDVAPDDFLTGGAAWRRCRDGQVDPNRFGVFEMRGFWFIRGNLVRDLASLNKMELLPWDLWGIIEEEDGNMSENDNRFLDGVAALTLADNIAFPEVRSTYRNDERLRTPSVIRSYLRTGVQTVSIGE